MSELINIASTWAKHDPDPNTKNEILQLISTNNINKLQEIFSGDLEFGTAGLRAEIGPGQSRMNRAVVIRATFGLCQYLLLADACGAIQTYFLFHSIAGILGSNLGKISVKFIPKISLAVCCRGYSRKSFL